MSPAGRLREVAAPPDPLTRPRPSRMGTALAGLAGASVGVPAMADPDALLDAEEQAWVARHPVVLFAPERDFPPFSFVDSQGQHRGLSADALELVQQHTGLKLPPV